MKVSPVTDTLFFTLGVLTGLLAFGAFLQLLTVWYPPAPGYTFIHVVLENARAGQLRRWIGDAVGFYNLGYSRAFITASLAFAATHGTVFPYLGGRPILPVLAWCLFGWALGAVAAGAFVYAQELHPAAELLFAPVTALSLAALFSLLGRETNTDTPVLRGTVIEGLRRTETPRAGQLALAGVVLPKAAEVRHFAIVGVSGAGKSTAIRAMLRGAFNRGDRGIVADVDGSYMEAFFQDGDTILTPYDPRSARWDILAEIREQEDYAFLANAILPLQGGDPSSTDWRRYGQSILAASLKTWHEADIGSSAEFFDAMANAPTEKLAQLCTGSGAARYFEPKNERMLGSILGVMVPALETFRRFSNADGKSFSVRGWVREGTGRLWLPYRGPQIPAIGDLLGCWMHLAISETMSLPADRNRRVWFVLDELDALGRVPSLKDGITRLRKHGGCCLLGFQSIGQLNRTYGEAEAQAIVENTGNKLILRCGVSEGGGTAKFASDLIGEREVTRSETSSTNGNTSSTSQSNRQVLEKAVLPSEIENLKDGAGYLRVVEAGAWKQVKFPTVPSSVL